MKSTVFRRSLALVLPALALLVCAPGRAQLVITPTFDSSLTSDPNAATILSTINSAINFYQSTFSNNVNVLIKFQAGGGLGTSNTTIYNIDYATFRSALAANATTADDATALAHLPVSSTNPVTGSRTINVKTANIRALGIPGSFPPIGGFDGVITLNTLLTDPGNPSSSQQYDLLAVVEHEIDEVLGLGSSLPTPWQQSPMPEDLYRYDSLSNRSFNTNDSAHAYFSIDGVNSLVEFHNINDGADYGDWASSATPRVQDAYATPGAHPTIGVELRALDVIGYNFRPASVPEPSAFAFLGGLLLPGAFLMRRRLRG
jgi:hypothetical protein